MDQLVQMMWALGWVLLHPQLSPPSAHLDLPLLTLTPCDGDLCVDLRPPVEDLREIYESLRYSLRISSNGVEGTKVPHQPGSSLPPLSPSFHRFLSFLPGC